LAPPKGVISRGSLLALKLILAHFMGDFILEPYHWVDYKFIRKGKSKYLYYHIDIHLTLLLL